MTADRDRSATPPTRSSLRRAVPAGAGVLVVGGSLALTGVLGSGNPTGMFDLTSGGAWVVSPEQGLVSLLDGASERVAVSLRVPGAGHALSVTQSGTDAYLVDQDEGTVARVDAARYEFAKPVRLGTAGGRLAVLRNDPPAPGTDGVVYVVDAEARTAAQVDPETLAVRHEVALSAQPGPEQATVDDAGRLVVADADRGTVTLVDPGRTDEAGRPTKAVRRIPTVTETTRLVLVQGAPVLVDVAAGTVQALAPDGHPRPARCLDTRASDEVQVLGSSTGPEVFAAVSDAGALLVSSTDEDSCTRTVAVAAPDADAQFGPLAQSGPYVFVPDRSTGETAVVDTRTDEVLARLSLAAPGNQVELRSKDGIVFFNDLDSETAGVISLDGGQWSAKAVEKYDPETGEGVAIEKPDEPEEEPAALGEAPAAAPEQSSTPAPDAAPPSGSGGSRAGPPSTGKGRPTARGPAPQQPVAPPIVPAGPVLSVDALTPDAAAYNLGQRVVVTPTVTGAAADTVFAWSATLPSGPVPFAAPAAGQPLVIESVPAGGTLTVTLTASGTTGADSMSVDLPVTDACRLVVSDWIDFIDGFTAYIGTDLCTQAETVTLQMESWAFGPASVVVPAGEDLEVVFAQSDYPPVDGMNEGAIVATLARTGETAPIDVYANALPIIDSVTCTASFLVDENVTRSWWDITYRDGDAANATVAIRAGSANPVFGGAADGHLTPTFDVPSLESVQFWTVTVTDRYGEDVVLERSGCTIV